MRSMCPPFFFLLEAIAFRSKDATRNIGHRYERSKDTLGWRPSLFSSSQELLVASCSDRSDARSPDRSVLDY